MPEAIAEQKENERVYRQLLAEGVLAILLPTEDLQNPCLTSLVGQIFSELIFGNIIASKASQPWLLFEGLSILVKIIKEEPRTKAPGRGDSTPTTGNQGKRDGATSVQNLLIPMLHKAFLVFAAIRFLITSLVISWSLPSRLGRGFEARRQLTSHATKNTSFPVVLPDDAGTVKMPVVAFKVWTCAANLIEMEQRMPWLGASLSMLQLGLLHGPGGIANVDGIMDR
jgi:hypothetical protein